MFVAAAGQEGAESSIAASRSQETPVSRITRIEIDVAFMRAGDPCFRSQRLDREGAPVGEPFVWQGFDSVRGVVFVKAEAGRSWIEHHGDYEDLMEGGLVYSPTTDARERVLFNLLAEGHLARLAADLTLTIVGVNKGRVAKSQTAVTAYTHQGGALVPSLRMEGLVRSAVNKPPIVGSKEPLNAWLETRNGVEFL